MKLNNMLSASEYALSGSNSIKVNLQHIITADNENNGVSSEFGQSDVLDIMNSRLHEDLQNEEKEYTINFDEVDLRADLSDDQDIGKEVYLEQAIVGTAKMYAEKTQWINENASTEEERIMMTKALDSSYIDHVAKAIRQVSSDLDDYFSSGDGLLQGFSKEELPDLFDKEMFSSHLADMAIEAKNFALETGETVSKGQIQAHLINEGTTSSRVENMSYWDMLAVVEFIDRPQSDEYEVNDETQNVGQVLAQKEMSMNKQINALGVSDIVKNSMMEVGRRESEGIMRSRAFGDDMKYYASLKKELDEEYQRLMERLERYAQMIEELKELNLIDPSTDRLMDILKSEGETKNQLRSLKDAMNDVNDESDSLENNPSSITEGDSYKRMKAEYEDEKAKVVE